MRRENTRYSYQPGGERDRAREKDRGRLGVRRERERETETDRVWGREKIFKTSEAFV